MTRAAQLPACLLWISYILLTRTINCQDLDVSKCMPDVLRSFPVISTDSIYQLPWLDQVDSETFSHHKEAINAKATVTWGSASASYEDFDEQRTLFKRRQKYELNQAQSARFLFQGLNSDAVGIVHDCLNLTYARTLACSLPRRQ